MKSLLYPLAALLLLHLPHSATAQQPPLPAEQEQPASLPQWLVDFSNIKRELREAYLINFNRAKLAYLQGEWISCITLLAECEMVFKGNPNIWNLRACCLMEQKLFDEAAAELDRASQALPHDPVTTMNRANLQLARGQYEPCLTTLTQLRSSLPCDTPEELLHVLTFRQLLCLILLDREPEARKLVEGLSPVADTPLYYYSQAAFAAARNDRAVYARSIRVANAIFANNHAAVPYQRALIASGITSRTPAPQADK